MSFLSKIIPLLIVCEVLPSLLRARFVFGGAAESQEVTAPRVWGLGFERCDSQEMEPSFKDASSLIFPALVCLPALSLKLPTWVAFFIKKFLLPSALIPESECGALKEERVCVA